MNFYKRALTANGDYGTLALDRELTEELLTILRRDWAVSVLDAHAVQQGSNVPAPQCDRRASTWTLFLWMHGRQMFAGATPGAARLAAALAVYPKLPADKRAQLGECP